MLQARRPASSALTLLSRNKAQVRQDVFSTRSVQDFVHFPFSPIYFFQAVQILAKRF